jgi:hypothetical protein
MYNDIRDLKIHMSSRAKGKVTRYESAYNPCERCKVLTRYMDSLPPDSEVQGPRTEDPYSEAKVA